MIQNTSVRILCYSTQISERRRGGSTGEQLLCTLAYQVTGKTRRAPPPPGAGGKIWGSISVCSCAATLFNHMQGFARWSRFSSEIFRIHFCFISLSGALVARHGVPVKFVLINFVSDLSWTWPLARREVPPLEAFCLIALPT